MEINLEKLCEVITALAKWAEKVITNVRKFLHENLKRIKAAAVKWYQLEEEKKVVIRQRYKRDFSRRKISLQVMDRRPRFMIRKIIR